MATWYRYNRSMRQAAPFECGQKTIQPALLDAYVPRIQHRRRGRTSKRGVRAMSEDSGNEGSWLSLPLKHVIESQQFGKDALEVIFKVSREMEDVRPNSDASRQLQGAVMSTLFYEPSTRTRLSFESAMTRLGGSVLSTESAGEYSSAAKGETLEGMFPSFCIFCGHYNDPRKILFRPTICLKSSSYIPQTLYVPWRVMQT